MYRKNLDPKKLLLLQKRLPDIEGSWKTAIGNFIELLKTIQPQGVLRFAAARGPAKQTEEPRGGLL
ncbi:MAG: hypothetical protein PF508_17800 [Spirochaeta sp.]|jgi:hypothetical protein|nr:hypothetical protein [Spirochaeta sp.]